MHGLWAVSYTHLDVYKRQAQSAEIDPRAVGVRFVPDGKARRDLLADHLIQFA